MEERIKTFMKAKGINAAELADTIGVQRSNVSHVLNGRNKPGFSFIEKLLHAYPDLNARWLLIGGEEMLKKAKATTTQPQPRNLFNQFHGPEVSNPVEGTSAKESKERAPAAAVAGSTSGDNVRVEPARAEELDKKDVERVIIFYSDGTFKAYKPG
ncbi:hypothetical protein MNBD_BACTEROID01-2413 [hydrothermal vent metagenome]|uniref:HTH cro/C1-type domain-containing protein n=1 Tax=hydrothermal vent metagenome TaxID=652676 RepID=A0A3B0TDC6_9ZZZZ